MARKRMTPAQLKNLPQYKNKSGIELEIIAQEIAEGDFAQRVEETLEKFKEDYDLTEMTENDRLALSEFAKVSIILEDLTEDFIKAREQGEWNTMGQINREIHRLRDDFSNLQRDLNITRRSRQESDKQSVVDYIEGLKRRAKHFLDKRLCEVYCPQCNILLAKVWLLYPEENNTLEFTCKKCGRTFYVKKFENNKNIEVGPPI